MRDIRSDLQERTTLIEAQIRAAYAHFERIVQQLQNERDAKITDLKSGLAMINESNSWNLKSGFWASCRPLVPRRHRF